MSVNQIAVGGSSTHVVLEFPDIGHLYMGSLISLSYSVYRDKTPVFNCGSQLVDGFAIGNKYVAGSMVTTMYSEDELSDFMKLYGELFENLRARDGRQVINRGQSLKPIHTFMKDDLTEFNIHVIFASEYSEDTRRIVIYDSTFINNGQVMSVDDIVTETTLSYVARDLKENHSTNQPIRSLRSSVKTLSGSQLLRQKREGAQIVNNSPEFNNPTIPGTV